MESEKKEVVVSKKDKLDCPKVYEDKDNHINMSGKMITNEFDFLQIWGKRYKGKDMKKAYKKARSWRDKYK